VTLTTYDEIKSLAKLPTKAVPLCLRGDLQAEYEELEREQKALKERQKRGGTLSGSSDELKALEEKIAVLREEMQESTKVFTLRGLPKKKFSDLKASKPLREEDKESGVDYNGEEFPVLLVQACLVDPALTIPEVEDLVETVFTQGQWDLLFWSSMYLNRGTVEIPS
jgi:predicted nuclease with TOPRIM domain